MTLVSSGLMSLYLRLISWPTIGWAWHLPTSLRLIPSSRGSSTLLFVTRSTDLRSTFFELQPSPLLFRSLSRPCLLLTVSLPVLIVSWMRLLIEYPPLIWPTTFFPDLSANAGLFLALVWIFSWKLARKLIKTQTSPFEAHDSQTTFSWTLLRPDLRFNQTVVGWNLEVPWAIFQQQLT